MKITVQEIIKQLQDLPQDLEIEVQGYDDGRYFEYNLCLEGAAYDQVTQDMIETVSR